MKRPKGAGMNAQLRARNKSVAKEAAAITENPASQQPLAMECMPEINISSL